MAIFSASCDKTITAPQLAFDLAPNAPTLFRGSSIRLDPGSLPGGLPASGPFKWSSSDTAIVRVDGTGLITGVTLGTANIRALTAEGYAETSVRVIDGGGTLRTSWLTTCGISQSDGALYCWGRNNEGQLGIGAPVIPVTPPTPQTTPAKVSGGLSFTSVSPAAEYTCGMTTTGPYCWGVNSAFIVNDGIVPPDSRAPVKVVGGERFTRIEANGAFFGAGSGADCSDRVCGSTTCALTAAGDVFCWRGAAPPPFSGNTPFNPLPVAGAPRLASIAAGVGKDCGIALDKRAYCWGSNYYGSAGTNEATAAPHDVREGLFFQAISPALDHTCALDIAGDAYCWGANSNGQLGAPSSETCRTRFQLVKCRATPAKVEGGYKYLAIAAGMSNAETSDLQPSSHTCGVTVDLDIVCWGYNEFGQLGNSAQHDFDAPTKVETNLKFRSVTAGFGHTCAITIDGIGYCWGSNTQGQLGNGTLANSSAPVRIAGGLTFK